MFKGAESMVSENLLVSSVTILVDIVLIEIIIMFGKIIYDDFKSEG